MRKRQSNKLMNRQFKKNNVERRNDYGKEEFEKIFSSESKFPSMQLLRELSFMTGWDSCMKYLAMLPLDEEINELVDYVKANHPTNE